MPPKARDGRIPGKGKSMSQKILRLMRFRDIQISGIENLMRFICVLECGGGHIKGPASNQ